MEDIKVMDQAMRAIGNREGKYLTFTLADEEYGIGILKEGDHRDDGNYDRPPDTRVHEGRD